MAKAIAHPNLALIKYWGKTNLKHNLPSTPSLSVTLNNLTTTTSVKIQTKLSKDKIFLNDNLIENRKIISFMNQIRKLSRKNVFTVIKTKNNFPTAAGYASSASGFAALSLACNQEFQLGLSPKELACLARDGSGSATRSLSSGLVAWEPGNCEKSFGYQILPAHDVPLAVFSFKNTDNAKTISSTKAMEQVRKSSPYYDAWIKSTTSDFNKSLNFIKNNQWVDLLKLAEINAFKMHATMLSSQPPIIYWEPQTISLIKRIQKTRQEKNLIAYISIDAGANIKLLTLQSQVPKIINTFQDLSYTISLPGEGAKLID